MNPISATESDSSGARCARMRELVTRVVSLLDTASRELEHSREAAKSSICRASRLLQEQIGAPTPPGRRPLGRGLLAWQARRVREYIDLHIGSHILVADLGGLVQRSEAHFSRAFKRTFGEPPHAYLLRRRVELAIRLMLANDAPLSEIALRCGFTDQAHLCKQFRQFTGETPAAWRRVRRGGMEPTTFPAGAVSAAPISYASGKHTLEFPHRGDVVRPVRAAWSQHTAKEP